jgi:hypothetical protein
VDDRFTAPGVGTDIDTNRAIVCTYSALYTAGRVWHDLSRREQRVSSGISFENVEQDHRSYGRRFVEKDMADFIIGKANRTKVTLMSYLPG